MSFASNVIYDPTDLPFDEIRSKLVKFEIFHYFSYFGLILEYPMDTNTNGYQWTPTPTDTNRHQRILM